MRIGLVIEHFDPRRGGAEQWTCRLAEWLLAQGHEVHVVCQEAGKGDRRRLPERPERCFAESASAPLFRPGSN
jgi:glycosyltransferase involved in cell wall biosynthesis